MNRLVVVSNRVPIPAAGAQAGGLAVALDGLMEKRGGLWFGWSGSIAADAHDRDVARKTVDKVEYATIDLTEAEHEGYYNKFSNSVLWPLLHTMPELVKFDRRDARTYRDVNAYMAARLAPLLRPTDIIWIHDYHLLTLPAELRARGVTNPIGFFLHIPHAAADVLTSVPEMGGLIKDLLSADLVGFQTAGDRDNFAAAAQVMAGAVQVSGVGLHLNGRRTRLGVFPVEIDPHSFAETAAASWRSTPTERLRRSLDGQSLILGVDRLDPTKGLLQRLAGFRRLLERDEKWRRRTTLLQIAAISRKDVSSYRSLRAELEREAGALNGEWADPDWTPLRLIAKAGPRDVVAGYMRQARVGLVTPLRDGMNLVAKEFVAAQDPQDPGVLILSQFAGAARQLDGAMLVNPHDRDATADAMDAALEMSLAQRQERWQSMWRSIQHGSPLAWGRSFVSALLRTPSPILARPSIDTLPLTEPLRSRPAGSLRQFPEPRQLL